MWPKKSVKQVAVAWNGVRINLDMELPIIKTGVIQLLRHHRELELSKTREGELSVDQLTRDIAAREQQLSLLQDADAATRYSASRNEIERTAKLLSLQAQIVSAMAPIIFVGEGDEANAIDFGFAAALAVAQKGDGDISFQVKALIGIALECARSELEAAKAMLASAQSVAQAPAVGNVITNVAFPASPPVAKPTAKGSLKVTPGKVRLQPELMGDPEPWKAKRMSFNKGRLFTTAEYLAHFKTTWPDFQGVEETTASLKVSARLLEFANALRMSVSNVVSLRKSDLDDKSWPEVIRAFLEEFFPPGYEKQSFRVSAIMSALLDAEDLHEEKADLLYIGNHLLVASELLDEEVAFQTAQSKPENPAKPASAPVVERIWTRNPDGE